MQLDTSMAAQSGYAGLSKTGKGMPDLPGESRKASCRRSSNQDLRALWWEVEGEKGGEQVSGRLRGLEEGGWEG